MKFSYLEKHKKPAMEKSIAEAKFRALIREVCELRRLRIGLKELKATTGEHLKLYYDNKQLASIYTILYNMGRQRCVG